MGNLPYDKKNVRNVGHIDLIKPTYKQWYSCSFGVYTFHTISFKGFCHMNICNINKSLVFGLNVVCAICHYVFSQEGN